MRNRELQSHWLERWANPEMTQSKSGYRLTVRNLPFLPLNQPWCWFLPGITARQHMVPSIHHKGHREKKGLSFWISFLGKHKPSPDPHYSTTHTGFFSLLIGQERATWPLLRQPLTRKMGCHDPFRLSTWIRWILKSTRTSHQVFANLFTHAFIVLPFSLAPVASFTYIA
jgi:hypothetical protein